MESNAKICKMNLLFGFENHIFVLQFAFEYAKFANEKYFGLLF